MQRNACSSARSAAITIPPARPDLLRNSALFTDEDLRQLAARSMSLYERVGEAPTRVYLAERAFHAKLDIWRRQAADGDEELFRRRLDAEGLSPGDLPDIIAGHAFTAPELPEWCLF